MKGIKLRFDQRVHRYGSKEHFWHFLFGYLLPAIHFYYDKVLSSIHGNNSFLIFEDCGPLMNPIIQELASIMDVPFKIKDNSINEEIQYDREVYLPRWDIRLYISIYFLMHPNRYSSNIPIRREDWKWFFKKSVSFRRKTIGLWLKRDVLYTRNLILKNLISNGTVVNSHFLFIDRSESHAYYSKDGTAEVKGYGKSRRALKNLNLVCDNLSDEGIRTAIFEPGAHGLRQQIETFNSAKGIVAMRGAELANMLWMTPGTKVIIVGFSKPAFHLYNLASLLNIKLIEYHSDTDYPDLQDFNIKKHLIS